MHSYYNQNYTKKEISTILKSIKNCIKNNRYTIALNENRLENISFINEYNIRSNIQKSILLKLKINDFCHTLQNSKIGREYETLYVFVPQISLFNYNGIKKNIDIYIKINFIDTISINRVVVISFHKRNKPIKYLFR